MGLRGRKLMICLLGLAEPRKDTEPEVCPNSSDAQRAASPRRLVVCCDGTWNKPDQRYPTNVIKAARAILPVADRTDQIVYYDQGVGTGNLLDRVSGGAFGSGLEQNIREAYRFLMHNYEDGDELYLFGFSRGAYTVRSLAGLIRNVGLLRKVNAAMFPEAYALYRSDDFHPRSDEADKYRKAYSWEIGVKFIGVWDTVGALGIPIDGLRWMTRGRYEFHDLALSSKIHSGYQALSVDDKRKVFTPAIWEPPAEGQTIEQTWFAGCHADVGGGVPDNGLPDLALCWLVDRAKEQGLVFDDAYLKSIVTPDHRAPLHESYELFYRFWAPLSREIGTRSTITEAVHQSVIERMQNRPPTYLPENVRSYQRIPDARIDGRTGCA